jgi:hypothetical protein
MEHNLFFESFQDTDFHIQDKDTQSPTPDFTGQIFPKNNWAEWHIYF